VGKDKTPTIVICSTHVNTCYCIKICLDAIFAKNHLCSWIWKENILERRMKLLKEKLFIKICLFY